MKINKEIKKLLIVKIYLIRMIYNKINTSIISNQDKVQKIKMLKIWTKNDKIYKILRDPYYYSMNLYQKISCNRIKTN